MHTTRIRPLSIVILIAGLLLPLSAHAAVTLSIAPAPVTWNVIGLDSNSPASGPRFFPVGARICSSVATTNVSVTHVWDSANANINLRAGSPSTIILPSIGAGQCVDAYFEVDVTQTPAAFDTTRRFHITATDLSDPWLPRADRTRTRPTPRERSAARHSTPPTPRRPTQPPA